MKKSFEEAVIEASEARALFVLLVVIALRIWRIIPTLRPHQLIIPATLLQIAIFVFAVLQSDNFIPILAIGNFIVVGIALLPFTFQQPKLSAHWVK